MLNSRQSCWLIGFTALVAFAINSDPLTQWRTFLGLLIALLVSLTAYVIQTISLDALAPSTLIGTIAVGFGGWSWGLMIAFYFFSSSLLGMIKKGLNRYEIAVGDRRTASQVWANGMVITLLLIANQLLDSNYLEVGAAAGLATATADTWATEIGMRWNKFTPRLISNWKPVVRGSNGAITLIGTLGGALGSILIALITLTLANYPKIEILSVVFGAGILGMLLDSLLGATWERSLPGWVSQWMGQQALSNNQVNALAIAGSAIVAMLVII
jgi:uncharacterized protein (TIGR00297 family)